MVLIATSVVPTTPSGAAEETGLPVAQLSTNAMLVVLGGGAPANADAAAQQSAVHINVLKSVFMFVITDFFLIFVAVGFDCCLGRTIPVAIHDLVCGWFERSRNNGIARGNVLGGTGGKSSFAEVEALKG